MNIETLLQAAEILENQQSMPPKKRLARGECDSCKRTSFRSTRRLLPVQYMTRTVGAFEVDCALLLLAEFTAGGLVTMSRRVCFRVDTLDRSHDCSRLPSLSSTERSNSNCKSRRDSLMCDAHRYEHSIHFFTLSTTPFQ